MGSFSKQKGKRGEREAVNLLKPTIEKVYSESDMDAPVLFRNQNQSANGGYDIDGLSWLALEVKRCEVLSIAKWWEQTNRQASGNQAPVLLYRQNGKKWRVRMWGYLQAGDRRVKAPVDIEIETFLVWFEVRLKAELVDTIV